MSGASELHNAVNAELFAAIYPRLPDECRAFMSDMKVKVEYNGKTFSITPILWWRVAQTMATNTCARIPFYWLKYCPLQRAART